MIIKNSNNINNNMKIGILLWVIIKIVKNRMESLKRECHLYSKIWKFNKKIIYLIILDILLYL